MDALTVLATIFLLFSPIEGDGVETVAQTFRVQAYPFGGYYSYPPYCAPSYYYGPGYGYYRRGPHNYVGPGYPYYSYNDPRCYYWGHRRYYGGYGYGYGWGWGGRRWGGRGHGHHGGHHGGHHRGGHHGGGRHH